MDEPIEILQITEAIPYRTFKEKIEITKEFDHKGKMVVEDKYIYLCCNFGGGDLMFNRKMYKEIKKYDRDQMQKFCENLYSQGFKDGSKSGNNADFRIKLSEVLNKTPGIGPKRYDDIMMVAKEMEI